VWQAQGTAEGIGELGTLKQLTLCCLDVLQEMPDSRLNLTEALFNAKNYQKGHSFFRLVHTG
jgi:hypothetical protein